MKKERIYVRRRRALIGSIGFVGIVAVSLLFNAIGEKADSMIKTYETKNLSVDVDLNSIDNYFAYDDITNMPELEINNTYDEFNLRFEFGDNFKEEALYFEEELINLV